MYYFYCPKCRKEDEVNMLPAGTLENTRGGSGIPVHHYKCSKCGNLYAGFMKELTGDPSEMNYYRYIISKYQTPRC